MSDRLTFNELKNFIKTYYPEPPPFNSGLAFLSALSSGNTDYLSNIFSTNFSSGLKSLDTSFGKLDFGEWGGGTKNPNEKDSYYKGDNVDRDNSLSKSEIDNMTPEEKKRAYDNYLKLYDISLNNGFIDRDKYSYIKDITSRLFDIQKE